MSLIDTLKPLTPSAPASLASTSQQEELSEEERSGRVTELLKEVTTEALRESSKVDLASTLLRHK